MVDYGERRDRRMRDKLFGEKLRQLREERGLTLHELAQQAGLHQSTISRLETDLHRRPHMETFILLARGFGVSIQELALLTEMLDPATETGVMIQDEHVIAGYHLLDRKNMELLQELHGIDEETREHLIRFIHGLQRCWREPSCFER